MQCNSFIHQSPTLRGGLHAVHAVEKLSLKLSRRLFKTENTRSKVFVTWSLLVQLAYFQGQE